MSKSTSTAEISSDVIVMEGYEWDEVIEVLTDHDVDFAPVALYVPTDSLPPEALAELETLGAKVYPAGHGVRIVPLAS